MHPMQSHRQHLAQQQGRRAVGTAIGLFRRWLVAAFRQWQRRKMIATLESMDDRLLRDIGVIRGDIPRLVHGLLEFEPENAAMASAVRSERHDAAYRKAA